MSRYIKFSTLTDAQIREVMVSDQTSASQRRACWLELGTRLFRDRYTLHDDGRASVDLSGLMQRTAAVLLQRALWDAHKHGASALVITANPAGTKKEATKLIAQRSTFIAEVICGAHNKYGVDRVNHTSPKGDEFTAVFA